MKYLNIIFDNIQYHSLSLVSKYDLWKYVAHISFSHIIYKCNDTQAVYTYVNTAKCLFPLLVYLFLLLISLSYDAGISWKNKICKNIWTYCDIIYDIYIYIIFWFKNLEVTLNTIYIYLNNLDIISRIICIKVEIEIKYSRYSFISKIRIIFL